MAPQPGPQEMALSSPADIVILGGAAGGGKTWTLVYEGVRHSANKGFTAVYFRRTRPLITNPGGMWDEAHKIYPHLGARLVESPDLEARFPSGATVRFAHMQHAKNRLDWKGAQIALIAFDQLEEFEEDQFWYMLSRNRSTCGVRPYVRATCNPVPDDDPTGGWLCRLLAWWIDQDTGYAIPERAGVIRYFVRKDDKSDPEADTIIWGSTVEEVIAQAPEFDAAHVKSLTFVPATLEDNRILESIDPGYRGWLLSLPLIERERLLKGNWKIRPSAGKVFNRAWFKEVNAVPHNVRPLRYWDKAGTPDGGDWSAGVLVSIEDATGRIFIEDAIRGQWSSLERNNVIQQAAADDGDDVPIRLEQEPGSGGKESAEISVRELGGYDVKAKPATGEKLVRYRPLAAQAEAGNVYVVRTPGCDEWIEPFLRELHNIPEGAHDDQADAAAGAYNELALPKKKVRAAWGRSRRG